MADSWRSSSMSDVSMPAARQREAGRQIGRQAGEWRGGAEGSVEGGGRQGGLRGEAAASSCTTNQRACPPPTCPVARHRGAAGSIK